MRDFFEWKYEQNLKVNPLTGSITTPSEAKPGRKV